MENIKRIAVYCASSSGNNEIYYKEAYHLGQVIAKANKGLVYGGAKVGLMGAVADGTLSLGQEVIGVIPTFLTKKELQHSGLTETIEVETMHQRKAKMMELADAFIAMPGGFGTMEELFEVMTWAQLALHKKPIGLLNVDGFYNIFIDLVEDMIARGFVKDIYRDLLIVDDNAESLVKKLDAFVPFENDKWFVVK